MRRLEGDGRSFPAGRHGEMHVVQSGDLHHMSTAARVLLTSPDMTSRIFAVAAGTPIVLMGIAALSGWRVGELSEPSLPAATDLASLTAELDSLDRWRGIHQASAWALIGVLVIVSVWLLYVAVTSRAARLDRTSLAVAGLAIALLGLTAYIGYAVPWEDLTLMSLTSEANLADFAQAIVESGSVGFGLFEVRGRSLLWLGRMHEWYLPFVLVASVGYLIWRLRTRVTS